VEPVIGEKFKPVEKLEKMKKFVDAEQVYVIFSQNSLEGQGKKKPSPDA